MPFVMWLVFDYGLMRMLPGRLMPQEYSCQQLHITIVSDHFEFDPLTLHDIGRSI